MEIDLLIKDILIPILTLFFGVINIIVIYRALKIQSETYRLNTEKHKLELQIEKINFWPDIDLDITTEYIGADIPENPNYNYGSHKCILNINVLKNTIILSVIKVESSDIHWFQLSSLNQDFIGNQLNAGNTFSIVIGYFNDSEGSPELHNEYMFNCEVIYDDLIGNRYSKKVKIRYKNKVVQFKETELNRNISNS